MNGSAIPRLDKAQYDTLLKNSKVFTRTNESFGFEYLAYNLLDGLLADRTIRYAMDYCFDRENAIEMGYGGLAEVAYSPVNNKGFVYTPDDATIRKFNIDKANELLDAAGYLDTDGDGVREKDGAKLTFELMTAAESSSWQSAVVNMLITNCGKAGIEITWNAVEKVTMWDTCADGNPDWQLTLQGWGGDADPGYIMCIFQDYNTYGYAGVSYSNPAFDEAYARVYSTIDPAERLSALNECQRIIYEDCPYTIICYDESVVAIDSSEWTGYNESDPMGLFSNERVDTYVNVKPIG